MPRSNPKPLSLRASTIAGGIAILVFMSGYGHSQSLPAVQSATPTDNSIHVPVSAPINTETAGESAPAALNSVLRIFCIEQNTVGTGFLHESGKIITAAHVVAGCPEPIIVLSDGSKHKGAVLASDGDLDVAVVSVSEPMPASRLKIAKEIQIKIGTQVSTWGYPGGYSGSYPLLSVGYLSGIDGIRLPSGKIVEKFVVNAAFNSGNSGGPLIDVENGEVIGIVSSKLAPISAQSQMIIQALEGQHSGFMYSGKAPDGSDVQISEGQLVGQVLKDLRGQIQLVIGYAVPISSIQQFLQSNGVTP